MKKVFKNLMILALLSPGIATAAVFQGIYGSVAVGMTQSYEKLQHDIDLFLPNSPGTFWISPLIIRSLFILAIFPR